MMTLEQTERSGCWRHRLRSRSPPNPLFTTAFSGLMNGDTPSSLGTAAFFTSATVTSAVGTYAIHPSGLGSSNYAIAYVDGTLTVVAPSAGGGESGSGGGNCGVGGGLAFTAIAMMLLRLRRSLPTCGSAITVVDVRIRSAICDRD